MIAIHSFSLGQTMIFRQEKCNQHACQGLSSQSIDPSAPSPTCQELGAASGAAHCHQISRLGAVCNRTGLHPQGGVHICILCILQPTPKIRTSQTWGLGGVPASQPTQPISALSVVLGMMRPLSLVNCNSKG